MTDIVRVTSLIIFGVTMTNGLSASEHASDITRSCAQTLYALRVLRTHGMCQKALQTIFQSVALPSFSMHQTPGADLSKRLIGKELMDFYVETSAVVTARLTFPHLLNNVPLLTNSILRKSVATVITCFTVSFLHLQLLHKTTTSDLKFSLQLPQHCV